MSERPFGTLDDAELSVLASRLREYPRGSSYMTPTQRRLYNAVVAERDLRAAAHDRAKAMRAERQRERAGWPALHDDEPTGDPSPCELGQHTGVELGRCITCGELVV